MAYKNWNHWTVRGNLTKDVEAKATQDGKHIYGGTIAYASGKDQTSFMRFKAWDVPEWIVAKMHKGVPVIAEGQIVQERWTGKDGTEQSMHVFYAQNIEAIPRDQANAKAPGYSAPPAPTYSAPRPHGFQAAPPVANDGIGYDDFDENKPPY